MSNHSSIASAKAGLEGLAKAAAADYAKRGIRVNVISPGLTETPLAAHLLANENSRSISENMHPVGKDRNARGGGIHGILDDIRST